MLSEARFINLLIIFWSRQSSLIQELAMILRLLKMLLWCFTTCKRSTTCQVQLCLISHVHTMVANTSTLLTWERIFTSLQMHAPIVLVRSSYALNRVLQSWLSVLLMVLLRLTSSCSQVGSLFLLSIACFLAWLQWSIIILALQSATSLSEIAALFWRRSLDSSSPTTDMRWLRVRLSWLICGPLLVRNLCWDTAATQVLLLLQVKLLLLLLCKLYALLFYCLEKTLTRARRVCRLISPRALLMSQKRWMSPTARLLSNLLRTLMMGLLRYLLPTIWVNIQV